MWFIIHWLPDAFILWAIHLIIVAGVGLYVLSKLIKWIPTLGKYKLILEIVGFALFGIGMYFYGGRHVEQAWQEKVKEVEEKLAIAEARSQEVIVQVETKVVEKVKVVKERVEVVRKEIQIQKEVVNAECKVNATAVELYNKAIADPDVLLESNSAKSTEEQTK